ncbi:TIGR02680 family protein [Virgibacillus byunsanensis]|uniref:TIGR02680 family protein n=1 Tax=Virgibacillus byunsanensis TaxID=570945 RepID=A0ABW3LIP0_9BACI
MSKQNKWKMNRAGLLNFWYYDDEIFNFADGKLLLRGSNGSGKSVTMQSILPVLLDGKKSPDRLDPFGSKARKMEDYLLGEKEIVNRDERTGYLFIEYKREDTNQYITTGIGLQARRNKAMNFWGFVITDNRRIGKDFALYETERNAGETQQIPLSRIQLENRIASGGQVVRTQGEYMKLVNKYIFGFETIEAYEDLIKLLIQLRSPKLSKDFRPTVIYEILEAALPPLTDEDLRHLSDTIEHMDQTKQQIEQLEREQTALNKLIKRYHTYNEYRLAEKAQFYVGAKNQFSKEDQLFQEKREGTETLAKEIHILEERTRELKQNQDTLVRKQERLQKHKVWNLEKERTDEMQALQDLKIDHTTKEKALTDKQRQELDTKQRQEQLQDEIVTANEELNEALEDLQFHAEDASFHQHAQNENDFQRYNETNHDFSVWEQEAETHYQVLDSIGEQLRAYEQMKQQLADFDKQIAGIRLELDKVRQEEQDWLSIFEKDKQEKLNDIHGWAENHSFLAINEEMLQKTSRDMYQLYDPTTYEQVRNPFVKATNDYQLGINKEIASLDSRHNALGNEVQAKEAELAEWKGKRDPEPPYQQEETRQARKQLAQDGHAYIPFYEAVEFQEHVPEAVQNRIEAALLDTGLLDTLITTESTAIQHDRIIQPNPNMMAHTLADYLQPDVDGEGAISSATIDEVLRSILVDGQSDGQALTIKEDGSYQIGLIHGHAVPIERVRFIGRSARKRYRMEKIEQITGEIGECKAEQVQLDGKIEELEKAIQSALDAMETFPNDDDLQESFSHINKKRFELNQHQIRLKTLDQEMNEVYQAYQSIKGKLHTDTRGLNLEFTHAAYQEAKRAMRTYEKQLRNLITKHITYRHQQENLHRTSERLEELILEVDGLKGELNVLIDKETRKQQNMNEIEKQLETQGLADIRAQIQEVQSQLRTTDEELDENKTVLPEKVVRKEGLENDMADQQQKMRFWENMIEAWEEVFSQEVNNGFIELPLDNETNESHAEWVVKHYKSFLKEKDSSSIEGQVTSVFYEQQPNLMEYRMTDTSIPVIEYPWMQADWTDEQRLQITNWKEKAGRRLIQLDFQGKRVNPYYIQEKLEHDRMQQQTMLDDQDRQLYEEILFDSVGKKLRSRIYRAQQWTEKMNKLMENSDSSSGLSFSIKWKPRTAETEAELDTKELVDLLRRDSRLLKEEDLNQVIEHFRSKIDRAKELVEVNGEGNTLLQVLKEVLDYRNWFSFVLSYQREGESKRELTNHAFYKFSGGEKAMAMYIPLFTACYSRYQEADSAAPYIISLDEAFAGVDENNIREMFEIVEQLGFDYMMNSQVLWGDYDTISSLSIYELVRPKNASFVTVIPYYWDGNRRRLVVDEETDTEAEIPTGIQ